ncbi:metal-sensitive transcriptional regulator [Candidatus Dojkabacteria bacterium]|uniref:Metal-sensitive transcriptional regulator n=1 Tax=Candidatus Dojkabacteria bacterium TaxID=2099670 RepID=A0A955L9B1_9BACT|nr:metal-sensitive transcriptional regulator [Candidatus Dojkabacteria bacterium]
MESQKLTNRLNRIQGQIEAIKKNLDSTEAHDCEETIQLLKAVRGALQKFGEAYIQAYTKECISSINDPIQMKQKYDEILQSALEL